MKMRRIALAASVLALVGFIYAGVSVAGMKEQVKVEEKTLIGDPAAADGVTIGFGSSVSGSLYWTHKYTFGGVQSTAFYSSDPSKYERQRNSDLPSISLYTDSPWELSTGSLADASKSDSSKEDSLKERMEASFADDVTEIITKLKNSAAASDEERNHGSIELNRLLKYYIIGGNLYSNAYDYSLDFNIIYDYPDLEKDQKAWLDINEFFRIPVIDNEQALYSIITHSDGHMQFSYEGNICDDNDDAFFFNTISCSNRNGVYFTFDAHTVNQELVDTSLIPGGYGLYMIPYDSDTCTLRTDMLKMVYSLDPETDYTYISASPDDKKLLLVHQTDLGAEGEVIDIATMTCDTKKEILKGGDDGEYIWCRDADEFLIFLDGDSKLAVFRYENGDYVRTMLVNDLDFELSALSALGSYSSKILYDGERLIVASYISLRDFDENIAFWGNQGCVDIAVIRPSGLAYYGRLSCNLLDYTDDDSFYKFRQTLLDERKYGSILADNYNSMIAPLYNVLSLNL